MPILSIKDNPPSKPFECSIIEKEGTWWIAKLKARQEKAFAFDLLKQNIDYYIPYYEKRTKRSDGKLRKSLLILFPSYVPFITENPYPLLRQNRVATFLPVPAQNKFKEQLHKVSIAHECGFKLEPLCHNTLQIGNIVKVIKGPLAGTVGTVLTIKNITSLVLAVYGLGSIKVTIDAMHVEPVSAV